jgi:peptide/nickel transport system permease protein
MKARYRYILQRAALAVFSIFVVASILFFIFRLLPGDPSTAIIAPTMSPDDRQALLRQYGLDEPLYVQYILYMKNLVMGDLGISFRLNRPVMAAIQDKLVNTLVLMLTAVVLAYILGIFIGAILAWNRNTAIDYFGTAIVLVTYAAPVFWVGMMAIMLFSFKLGWLPSGGMRSSTTTYTTQLARFLSVDFLRHLILPLTVTLLYQLTIPTFMMRNNMIDVLDADYIEMARIEGLSEFSILYRHAARSSLLPVVHHAAVSLGFAFGGSVVIETVFSWPGIGRLMWQAARAQDYPLAQGCFLTLATAIIVLNFFADVISVYVDPRAAISE